MWTWLPAGWRSHRKAEQIVREEIDAIGGQEMLMPVLQPADNWRRSGRYEITELFKLQDRREADLVLAMTHEEAVTWHVSREIRSYRDLPKILYHIQVKERDEPRPRAGVLRTREFIMKDSYSFDRDEEGLDRAYALHIEAYDRIFDRCGLEWYRVESDVGMMGGLGAHEYMAPCAAGENDVALSDAGYAANVEIASAEPAPVDGLPEPRRPRAGGDARRDDDRPGLRAARGPAGRPDQGDPGRCRGRGPVLALVRGDHRLNEIKPRTRWGRRSGPPRRTRSARSSAPCPASSDRWGRGWRWWPTRRCAGSAAWWRAATSRTSTSGASSPAATSTPPGATSARSRRAIAARTAA